jgi:phospholipid/cholesterol/gamma-HCH transport system substrate-binding protein
MKRVAVVFSAGLLLVAVVAGYGLSQLRGGHRLSVALPNAIGIFEGSPVQLEGLDVGQVSKVSAKGDKAVVEMQLDQLREPLHAGTTVTVEWHSLLDYHYLQLKPGPAANAVLPNGALIQSGPPQVLLEELLDSLDPATRTHLAGMVQQLNSTFAGSQTDFNTTLQTAGPTVRALGDVLNGIGGDGQSIKTLVSDLHKVSEVLAQRKDGLSSTVLDLNRVAGGVARQQQQFSDGLAELPNTLDSLNTALGKVTPATNATVPLLEDLRPAAEKLPEVAGNLRPVMHDLQPALHDLVPTLDAADRLLGKTPDFLDSGGQSVTQLRTTLDRAGPAVAFLRPYTPDVMGFLGNWAALCAGYDESGHFAQPLIVEGGQSLDANPGVTLPGHKVDEHPVPGALVGQPWTDANGSGPR